ncbi:hypothetical protein SAMN04488542_12916 [Fontibacillus panacisegetis]|uniref:Uncharacterized protein n=1 Tax=Fontibacillus panacisegetis TaxID=670482 RepID=A0A1G7S8J8_9BACL|nr:hypothetical protein SAMN04488542_12916 [Fontibacillus panacisegetis]
MHRYKDYKPFYIVRKALFDGILAYYYIALCEKSHIDCDIGYYLDGRGPFQGKGWQGLERVYKFFNYF